MDYAQTPLGPNAASGYQRFKAPGAIYFGASYVNFAGDHIGFVRGYNSLPNAMKAAKALCVDVSVGGPGTCVLYSLMVPSNFDGNIAGSIGLGQRVALQYQVFLGKMRADRYGAFAISGMAGWGYATNRATAQDATAAAMAECESGTNRGLGGYSKASYIASLKSLGLAKCHVVTVGTAG
ncbi:MAG: hypothetical protein KGH84_05995 [Paracoccaceae bacterium]|nr:hypothetical protein [Paracoccaceae bacterium]